MNGRRWLGLALLALALTPALGCSKKVSGPSNPGPPRTFMMGFSAIPPRMDQAQVIQNIDLWSRRADAAIIHLDPPWEALIAGVAPDTAVILTQLELAQYYRAKGLDLVVMVDLTNGLDRSAESPGLVAAGHSLTEPAVQQVCREYVTALDTLLHPDYLGLGAETNLIRFASPAPLYAAVKQVSNDAAADVRAVDPAVKLFVSVQVDLMWGTIGPATGYTGVATDLADFPFIQVLGLSSYPYLASFADPDSVPLNYYSRIQQDASLPVMVVEGGWTSASVGSVTSSPSKQARYIDKQMQMLDQAHAIGVFQLTFTDLDLTANPPPPGSILPLFAACGLVTKDFVPKPALYRWDAAFSRPRM